MKSFTDIDEFIESQAEEISAEGINSAEYWYARFDISEDQYERIATDIAKHAINRNIIDNAPFVAMDDLVCAIVFAFSVGLTIGLVHGSQYDDVTEE